MHMKNLVSAATLAIALGFTGTAFGQAVTLGTQTLSEADAERARVHCIDLQNRENAANPGSTDSDDDASDTTTGGTTGGTTDGSTDGSTDSDGDSDSDNGNATDNAASTSETDGEEATEEGTAGLIELDTVTLDQCMEAGLIE